MKVRLLASAIALASTLSLVPTADADFTGRMPGAQPGPQGDTFQYGPLQQQPGEELETRANVGTEPSGSQATTEFGPMQQQPDPSQIETRIVVRDDLTAGIFPYPELLLPPIFDAADAFSGTVWVELDTGVGDFFCSGTLINQRTILTAAHCIQNVADSAGVPDGDIAPVTYFAPDGLPDYFGGGGVAVTSHIVHAAYDRTAFYLGSDIALMSLSQPVSRSGRPGLTNGVPYVPLATSDPTLFETATLVGYGLAGIGSDPGVYFDGKRRIATNEVDYVGASDDVLGGGGTGQLIFTDFAFEGAIAATDYFCAFFWGPPSCTVTPTEGSTNGGDSGGPLFVDDGFGGYIQAGVTSGGFNACGGPQGGYCDVAFWTSVAAFNAWIQANSPLKNVSSVAGDALWTSAAHWTGGIVPDNFDTPVALITDFTNTARYFNVTLGASGTTSLNDAREIDELDIIGAGAELRINGPGSLFVWSQTTITNGLLRVDGALDTEYVDQLGGRVQGTGTIISAADFYGNFGGSLAPGNSIGTLTIVGDYVQGAGGLLEIEVTNGSSDLLDVTGNASLAGTLQVKQFGAAPLAGQSYTVLTTGGAVVGTFGTLDDQLPGLLFVSAVNYGADFVEIEIDASSFCTVASGPVQLPVCGALDAAAGVPAMNMSINGLQQLDLSLLPGALEALNPTRSNAQATIGLSMGDLLRNQFGRRSHDLFGSTDGPSVAQLDLARTQLASSTPSAEALASAATAAVAISASAPPSNYALANGYGVYFAADAARIETEQAGGIGTDEADVAALTAGLDHSDGKGFVAGVALSYLQSNVNQDYGFGGDTFSDGVALSAYASMKHDVLYADVYVSGAWLDFETERRLLVAPFTFATALGETSGNQMQAGATVGHALAKGDWARFGAVGGLYYISLDVDGYTETGAGPLSAVLASRSIDSLRSQLGGEVALHMNPDNDSLVPILRVVWNHEFMDDPLAATAAFAGAPAITFTSPGPDLGTDWATIGVGISGRIDAGTSFYFRYQHDLGRDGQENHEVSAAARMAF